MIVTLGLDDATARKLAVCGVKVRAATPDTLAAHLTEHEQPATAVIVGSGRDDPIALARRVRALDPQVPVVLVAPEGGRRKLAGSLADADVPGPDVTILDEANVDAVATLLSAGRASRESTPAPQEDASDAALQARLLDAVGEAIIAADRDGRVTFWNPAAERLYGWRRKDVVGRSARDRILDEVGRRQMAPVLEAVRRGETVTTEYEARHRSGRRFPARLTLSPVFDEDGRQIGQVGVNEDVTHERRTAARIRFQARLLDMVGQAVIATDKDGRITFWSRSAERIFGWQEPEARGRVVTDVILGGNAPQEVENARQRTHDGEAVSVEFEAERRDGSRFHARVTMSPVHDEHGRITGRIGVLDDLTEERRAEREIRFQARLLDAVEQAIAATDREGRVLYWNRAAEETYGWTRGDAVGRNLADLILAADADDVEQQVRDRVRRGDAWAGEVPAERRDGTPFPAWVATAPVLDERGRPAGVVAVSEDVTERKRAEAELARREERFRALAENAPDVITRFDRDLRIVYVNPAVEGLSGKSPDAFVGRHLDDVTPSPRLAEVWRDSLERVLETGEPTAFETPYATPDGVRFLHTRVFPELGPDGRVEHVVSTSRDLTALKRSELRLRFLTEVSTILGSSLDYATTLRRIAELAVPDVADLCIVYLRTPDGTGLERVTLHHQDAERRAELTRLLDDYPPRLDAPHGVGRAVRTGQPELLDAIPDQVYERVARTETQLRRLRTFGFRSAMAVPLVDRGRALGALSFVNLESERRFGPEDVELAQEVANRAAIAVENARLHRDTEHAAREARQRAERLHGLAVAAHAINMDLGVEETLEQITEKARTLVGAHQSATTLAMDDAWEDVVHTVSRSGGRQAPPEGGPRLALEAAPRLVRDRAEPVRLTGAELAAHPVGEALAADPPVRGWLAAPLVGRDGRTIGLIQLSDKKQGEFTQEDENILVQLAQMAAGAVENAHLYEAAQEAEARSAEQLQFTQAITSSLGEGVYVLDVDGRVTFVNPAAERMIGWREEELLGKRMHDVIHFQHPDGAPRPGDAYPLVGVIREGVPVSRDDAVFTRKDGSMFPVSYTSAPLTQEDGRITGAVVAFRDVSERKEAERRLRESEMRTRTTVESALDCIITIDAEGRILEFNPAAERTFGYRREEVLGKPMEDLIIPPRYRHAHRRGVATSDPGGGSRVLGQRLELPAMRADGSEFPAELAIVRIQTGRGPIYTGYLRDLSERKRAEAEVAEARQQVAMSEKLSALGTLVSGVAHEIRTPLTYMANHIFLLRRHVEALAARAGEGEDAEAAVESLRAATEGVDRINHLVRELRRYTKLQAGTRTRIRLGRVVADAVSLFNATHTGHVHVDVQVGDEPQIPLDAVQVQQVVLNLLQNAADVLPHGGPIRVETRSSEGGSVLVVEDEGPGIPEAVQAHLFEPFQSTKAGGMGLGLSIVRRIVDDHGGTIRVHTEAGEGTRFEIVFPDTEDALEDFEAEAWDGS